MLCRHCYSPEYPAKIGKLVESPNGFDGAVPGRETIKIAALVSIAIGVAFVIYGCATVVLDLSSRSIGVLQVVFGLLGVLSGTAALRRLARGNVAASKPGKRGISTPLGRAVVVLAIMAIVIVGIPILVFLQEGADAAIAIAVLEAVPLIIGVSLARSPLRGGQDRSG